VCAGPRFIQVAAKIKALERGRLTADDRIEEDLWSAGIITITTPGNPEKTSALHIPLL
jgi:hypothetical protein